MDATPFIRSSHYRVVKVLKTPVHSIQGSEGIKVPAVLWQEQLRRVSERSAEHEQTVDVDVNAEFWWRSHGPLLLSPTPVAPYKPEDYEPGVLDEPIVSSQAFDADQQVADTISLYLIWLE
jgi:hypothetical protein